MMIKLKCFFVLSIIALVVSYSVVEDSNNLILEISNDVPTDEPEIQFDPAVFSLFKSVNDRNVGSATKHLFALLNKIFESKLKEKHSDKLLYTTAETFADAYEQILKSIVNIPHDNDLLESVINKQVNLLIESVENGDYGKASMDFSLLVGYILQNQIRDFDETYTVEEINEHVPDAILDAFWRVVKAWPKENEILDVEVDGVDEDTMRVFINASDSLERLL